MNHLANNNFESNYVAPKCSNFNPLIHSEESAREAAAEGWGVDVSEVKSQVFSKKGGFIVAWLPRNKGQGDAA